jgi:tetratricopeptide (TPR) repeat protein/TolB-like protein
VSSIIEGYNYDIFISYRQKDNKYDGWVTEFVDNLKKELEATFKEEISVYFDINPHDGLLETHDVDASLKEKLKCLIFIPIISRTYCDPNSFAWEHEFKAFVEMASKDQFGLKIRLPVGNVASRVLPVRIHDLDEEDINMCGSVLGSVLRGVEFIYNSAGVNRPLRSKEEKPSENLKKTIYRDQINKISNAIREIVTGLRTGQGLPGKEKNESSMPWEETEKEKLITVKEKPTGLNKQKILSVIIPVAIILVLLGIYVYPKLIKESDKTNIEKSVAIMPFKNLTGDKTNDYIAEIQHNALYQELGKISQVKSLRVVGPTTTNVFEVNRMSIAGFARKVYVDYLVEGFVLSLGETQEIMIRVTQLFPEERVVFAENYASEPKNILKLYFNIAGLIAQKIGFELLPQDTVRLTRPQMVNPQSFEAYSRGMIEIEKGTEGGIIKGLEYLNEAVKVNPDDPLANAGLALGYLSIAHGGMDPGNALEKGEEYALKAMKLDSSNAYVHTALAETYLYKSWKYPESERHFKRALELNPNLDMAHYHYAWALYLWGRMDEAIAEHKLAQRCDPYNPLHTGWLGGLFCYAGRYEEAIQEALKSFEIRKDYPLGYHVLVTAYLGLGRIDEALETANKLIKVDTQDTWFLFRVYIAMGRREAASEILKEYESRESPDQYGLVQMYASLGKIDEAFRWLNYEPHSFALPWLALEELCKPLHSDPRWDEFLKRVNLLSK